MSSKGKDFENHQDPLPKENIVEVKCKEGINPVIEFTNAQLKDECETPFVNIDLVLTMGFLHIEPIVCLYTH